MRKFFAIIAAAIIMVPLGVRAADFPVKTPVAAVYDWAGFYLGGVVGYDWGAQESSDRLNLVGDVPADVEISGAALLALSR
jgi:opacity protein-like surface antigen